MPETRNQRRIRELLGEKEAEQDNSLQGKALERACEGKLPRTLTPWEWQQWYDAHGEPPEHRQSAAVSRRSWWRRILRLEP
jgi:hypothetical protein